MHAVWTRAPRSACRCYTCAAKSTTRAPSLVAARAKPAATKRIQLTTTLFYSTIISAAAAVDVKLKHDRSQELEEAIRTAEAGLVSVPRREECKDDGPSILQLNTGHSLTRAPNSGYASLAHSWKDPMDESRYRDKSVRWTPKKYIRVQYSIALLAARLEHMLVRLESGLESRFDLSDPSELELWEDQISVGRLYKKRLREIDHLDTYVFDMPPPPAPIYDATILTRQQRARTKHMNTAISNLFTDYASGAQDLKQILSRLIALLRHCMAVPDADTYTLLIKNFSSHSLDDFANSVVVSLVRARVRPNESLIATVLHFATSIDHRRYFKRWCDKMDNTRGGLMLAAPWVLPTNASAGRLRRSERTGKLMQSIEPDYEVFEARILGELHFGMADAAAATRARMVARGIQPSVKVLTAFMFDQARNLPASPALQSSAQWAAVLSQWREIERLADPASGTIWDPRSQLWAYQAMLHLCQTAGSVSDYQQILLRGIEHGIPEASLACPRPLFTSPAASATQTRRIDLMLRVAYLCEALDPDLATAKQRLHELVLMDQNANAKVQQGVEQQHGSDLESAWQDLKETELVQPDEPIPQGDSWPPAERPLPKKDDHGDARGYLDEYAYGPRESPGWALNHSYG